MNWLFDRRALPAAMRAGYAAKLRWGMTTLGMAWRGRAFVNLAAIRRFSILLRTMEHEALHLACGTGNERAIEALQRR